MSLHASSLAIQVGAQNEEIEIIANQLRLAPKMNSAIAKELLMTLRDK